MENEKPKLTKKEEEQRRQYLLELKDRMKNEGWSRWKPQ